ncbi:MAG: hypothetical protein QM698_07070 [Micropepsaceae bacterium]
MQLFLALMTIGAMSAAAGETAPDFEGRFTVTYQPVYCVRAPCPPGTFTIVSDNKRIGTARSVEIDDSALTEKAAASPGEGGISYEGAYWLADGKLIIRPTRAISGAWKDEPAPDGAAAAEAPFKFKLVNKTGDVIRGVYAVPASADHWGADRLSDNLRIKGSIEIDLPAGDCFYDIRIVLGLRPAEEIRRQDLCRDGVVTADRSGRIIDRVD